MDTVVLVHKGRRLFIFKCQLIRHHPPLKDTTEDLAVVIHEVAVLGEIVLDRAVEKDQTVVMIAITIQLMKIATIEMIVMAQIAAVVEVVLIHWIEVHPAEGLNIEVQHIVMIVEIEIIIVTSLQF